MFPIQIYSQILNSRTVLLAHYTIGISDLESHPCGGRVLKATANETFVDFGIMVSKNILETLLSVTGQWPCHPRIENCWIFVTISNNRQVWWVGNRQILIYFGSLSDKFVSEFVHGTIAICAWHYCNKKCSLALVRTVQIHISWYLADHEHNDSNQGFS